MTRLQNIFTEIQINLDKKIDRNMGFEKRINTEVFWLSRLFALSFFLMEIN